jgi:hypothetical protein
LTRKPMVSLCGVSCAGFTGGEQGIRGPINTIAEMVPARTSRTAPAVHELTSTRQEAELRRHQGIQVIKHRDQGTLRPGATRPGHRGRTCAAWGVALGHRDPRGRHRDLGKVGSRWGAASVGEAVREPRERERGGICCVSARLASDLLRE